LESIRILDGQAELLPYHQRRINRSRRMHYAKSPSLKLEKVMENLEIPAKGLYKLRIEYGADVIKQEIIPYHTRAVNSLKLVGADGIAYGRKYVDRSSIRRCLEKKGHCDDILMVQHGHLTDSSYANIALFDGKHWHTPAWPLLRGTRREMLLEKKIIRPSVIRARDLKSFQSIRLMNAMLRWEEGPTLDISEIVGINGDW
jgi:4-amino-4-deoxychorismate lyase